MLFLLMFACLSNKTSTLAWRNPIYVETFDAYAKTEKACYDKLLLQDMIRKGSCSLEVTGEGDENKSSVKTQFVCKATSYQIEVVYKTLKDRVLCSITEK